MRFFRISDCRIWITLSFVTPTVIKVKQNFILHILLDKFWLVIGKMDDNLGRNLKHGIFYVCFVLKYQNWYFVGLLKLSDYQWMVDRSKLHTSPNFMTSPIYVLNFSMWSTSDVLVEYCLTFHSVSVFSPTAKKPKNGDLTVSHKVIVHLACTKSGYASTIPIF